MSQHRAEFVTGAVGWQGMPDDGLPEVAVMGRSNVGKSSIINALLNRRSLARTSNTPGRTQQLNFFRVDERFYLVDLPGLGYAKVSRSQRDRWAELMTEYLYERQPLRLVIHLVDSRHPPTPIDLQAFDVLAHVQAQSLVVLTKSDKPKQGELIRHERDTRRALAEAGVMADVLTASAHKRRGLSAIWRIVREALEAPEVPPPPPMAPPSPPSASPSDG